MISSETCVVVSPHRRETMSDQEQKRAFIRAMVPAEHEMDERDVERCVRNNRLAYNAWLASRAQAFEEAAAVCAQVIADVSAQPAAVAAIENCVNSLRNRARQRF